ncbi:MAG: nitroreductase family protein [Planctomycetota bacterium]
MTTPANTSFPIHELLRDRFSPRAFADQSVSTEVLGCLFEAARWAPSAFNEQPWIFIAATREQGEDFARLGDCLVEGNAWAKNAPVLAISVAQTRFARNDKENRHAFHDVGLATAFLTLEAQAQGLSVHQMAGFDAELAKTSLELPENHEPVAMFAIGPVGDPSTLPDPLRERELAPRVRKPLSEVVFRGVHGGSFDGLADR